MFLHQSVILFTGGCLPPPGQTPTPWADTHPLGRHPAPWADTTPLGRHPTPLGRHPPAQCMLGHRQQAGGTHPTGMQSCPKIYFYHPQTREGNVFTDVCQSFCGSGRYPGAVGILRYMHTYRWQAAGTHPIGMLSCFSMCHRR